MSTIRIGVLQLCSTGDVDANLAALQREVEHCVARGAQFVCTPENTGWLRIGHADTPRHRIDQCPTVARCSELAARHGIWLLLGSTLLWDRTSELPTNSSLLFGPDGGVRARYDKLHLFRVDLGPDTCLDEATHVRAGQRPVSAEMAEVRIGLSICYDLRFPELYRHYAEAGCRILSIPAAFTERTGRDHWEVLLRARAIENQAWVVASAQWGHHGGNRTSFGRAMLVDPWGIVVAQAGDGVGSIVSELDLGRVDTVRRSLPALEHRRQI